MPFYQNILSAYCYSAYQGFRLNLGNGNGRTIFWSLFCYVFKGVLKISSNLKPNHQIKIVLVPDTHGSLKGPLKMTSYPSRTMVDPERVRDPGRQRNKQALETEHHNHGRRKNAQKADRRRNGKS